jgi:tetratricopeptide (TPR) repeat protein
MSKFSLNSQCRSRASFYAAAALVGLLLVAAPSARTFAQGSDSYETERARASRLLDEGRFLDALPVFEKLSKEKPTDAGVMFGLGFTMLAKANVAEDMAARKAGRAQARQVLVRARELGFNHPLLQSILESMRPDGESVDTFSKIKEADEAMREGEAAYVQGDLDKALAAYQRALQHDPQLYEAALFAGDMYNKKSQPDRAGEWFAKAIKIDPNRELAYRYWGIGLMARGLMTEARDKFIEAYLAEPHNRLANSGLLQWANTNRVRLGHPQIEFLSKMHMVENRPAAVNDPRVREGKEGESSWNQYGKVRAAWMSERFAREFPQEKAYRHTVREEVEALTATAEAAAEELKSGKVKSLSPSLATLVKLKEAGLLPAYVLLTQREEGIYQDYAAYRKDNLDKLKRYVIEFGMSAEGK